MTQKFPLVSVDPVTTTGVQLAADLENFSETMRTMMSGDSRADEMIEGLWLRKNNDGTAEIVYSNKEQDVDLVVYQIEAGGTGVALGPTVGFYDINIGAGAIDGAKIAAAAVSKDKLAADVLATSNEVLQANPPADQALSPQGFFDVDEIAVYDSPASAPTSLATNGYRRSFYVQSTGQFYRYVPAPVDAFVSQGAQGLDDLNDVDVDDISANRVLYYSGGQWGHSEFKLSRLFDVEVTLANNGDTLVKDEDYWVPRAVPQSLNDMSDVAAPTPTAGTLLYGDGSNWVPSAREWGLGHGQAWHDVLASRTFNVTYTNTTGRPIMIWVTYEIGAQDPRLLIGATNFGTLANNQPLIVPAGSTYGVFGSTRIGEARDTYMRVIRWFELR